MPEEKKFIMRNEKIISLRMALNDNYFNNPCRQHIWLCFDDGTKIDLDKNDRKKLTNYLDYGVRKHGMTSGVDIYEIAEIPEDFYEKLKIERESKLIPIKRIVDRRWGYDSDGRIIFEMPDGSYKYILTGAKIGLLKESDLKPVKNAHLLKEKFKETVTYEAPTICKLYGLKICGEDKNERKED